MAGSTVSETRRLSGNGYHLTLRGAIAGAKNGSATDRQARARHRRQPGHRPGLRPRLSGRGRARQPGRPQPREPGRRHRAAEGRRSCGRGLRRGPDRRRRRAGHGECGLGRERAGRHPRQFRRRGAAHALRRVAAASLAGRDAGEVLHLHQRDGPADQAHGRTRQRRHRQHRRHGRQGRHDHPPGRRRRQRRPDAGQRGAGGGLWPARACASTPSIRR